MNYLEKNKEQFLNDLKGLIEIESYLKDPEVYPTPEIITAVKYMTNLGEAEGFKTYADPEGYYGWIEIGSGEEMIGILGHLDVVPPGEDISRWTTPPFELTIDGDNLRGRGTQDDKGPVMLGFYLMKSMVESGVQLDKRIRLIFPTDEESFWRGVEKYKTDNQEIPKFGFTPDSTFPLIYSERELFEFKIVGQPTDEFQLKAGAALNVVPDKATYIKNGEEKVAEGKASHAMAPWNGVNAIDKLVEQISEEHELVKFIKTEINGEANGETLFGKVIKDDDSQLSFNFAKVQIDNEKTEIAIDIRIPNTSNMEELVELINDKLKLYPTLKYEFYDHLPGVFISKDSELVKDMMSSYKEVTGDNENEPMATGGATYARSMPNIVAFGPYMKDSPETEHQYNEYARFSDYVNAFNVYESMFKKFN